MGQSRLMGLSLSRNKRWLISGLLAIVLALTAFLSGCAAERRASPELASEDRQAALVSMSVAYHKRADLELQEGRREEAKEEMARLLAECYRHQVWSDEGLDVLYDGATRLARMRLEDKELGEAEAVARKALEVRQERPSLFRGYLHQTLADVLEKADRGKEAVDEHGRAIEVFQQILERRPPVRKTRSKRPAPGAQGSELDAGNDVERDASE